MSQLERTAREKLEEFTVSDIELLSSKYRNQLAKIIEQKPIIYAYINNIRQE